MPGRVYAALVGVRHANALQVQRLGGGVSAGIRSWLGRSSLGRVRLRAARRPMGAISAFLCLPDDIEFQIILGELHYPPIRHLRATSLQKRSLKHRSVSLSAVTLTKSSTSP